MVSNKDMWVIGVGASAGGLEALSQFVLELPESLPASIIIAQHLAPHAKSMMVELLSRKSSLQVTQAVNGLALAPNTVIIIPPNYDLTLKEGKVKLIQAGEETRPKPSVDTFFESLAEEYNTKAIAIILSGTGSDGSNGIVKVKELGGLAFAQDAASSKYDGMPNSAALTGILDFVGSPTEIAAKVAEIILSDDSIENPLPEVEDVDFNEILKTLKAHKNLDFTLYKPSTIKRRLDKRMKFVGINSMHAYREFLEANSSEADELSQEMLISVTSFFRDSEAFAAVEKLLAKMISQKKEGDDLRIWIAGCATGEEPYSFGMICMDLMESLGKRLELKIFASDLDHDAITFARNGIYRSLDVEQSVSSERIQKYFHEKAAHREVKKTLRDKIVFARQDMIHHPPFVKIDLISCRNVLIYFKAELQQKVFDIFHYALNTQGYLFLGKSETIPQGNNYFKTLDKSARIYQKSASTHISYPMNVPTKAQAHIPVKIIKKELPQVEAIVLKEILTAHGISAVIIDSDWIVTQIFGDVTEFLSLNAGLVDFKITNLLPHSIASEAHLLLKKADKDDATHRGRPHLIQTKDGNKFLHLVVKPFSIPNIKSNFMISFETTKAKESEAEEEFIDSLPMSGDVNEMATRIIELEHELMASKENLQAVVEELSVSNEELQSVNEEMSSTNEEMQASNEELETTNEELQSTNEELTTLNEELNVKTQELKLSNSSLENIQSSIGSPLVVIDSKLRVVRYNNLANKIFTLHPNSIGKSITSISCNAEIEDFEQMLINTIKTGNSSKVIVDSDKRFYQFQIEPSRDEMGKIIGAILIFFDNTEIVAAESKLQLSQHRVRSIIDGSPALIALKDAFGNYLTVNKAFLRFFNLDEKQVLGKSDRDIFDDAISTQFRDLDLEVLLRKKPTESQEKIIFNNKTSVFLASRFPLFESDNSRNPYSVGVVLFDVTQQVLAQEALESSEVRYRALIEDQAVFVTRFKSNGEITFVNKSFAAFFGGNANETIGRSFFYYVDRDKQSLVEKSLEQITTSNSVVTVEHTYKVLNQPLKWIRWILRGLFNKDGVITEIQAVGFDITEMRVRSDELQEKEKIYGSILSFSSDFLFVYKVTNQNEFELESFNRSAESSFVNTNNAYVGKNLQDFVDPDKYQKVLGHYQKTLETKKAQVYEETIELPSGTKNFQTTLVPILNDKKEVEKVAALSKDISKFKQVENALREEKKIADSASQSKSDFLASMSHELRTPLNVILGMTELLMTTDLNNDQSRYSDSIKKSGKMLLSLIEDVLDLSKIESGKITFDRKPFSLKVLCSEINDAFEIQAKKKGLNFHMDCDFKGDHSLVGDELRIRQVLVNLVSNAIKFTSKGYVEVKIKEDVSDSLISRLRFEVIDTGVGIPEESFNKLFTRFSQADSGHTRKYGGTGLGLAISKQLIELMHGDIGFQSENQQGSTFWFEIQLSRTKNAPRVPVKDREKIKDLKNTTNEKLKILIVDDYTDSHPLMKAFITRLGHLPTIMGSGQEVLNSLNNNEDYDLIFMDIQMPEMDGMETTRRIRANSSLKQIPIVALTANVLKGLKEETISAGMDDYLIKPVSIVSLKEKIELWKNHTHL